MVTLLMPMLYEKLTGKPYPGTAPKVDAPTEPATPVLSRPSVQLSTGALGIVTLLQAFGALNLPFNLGAGTAAAATTVGTAAAAVPAMMPASGSTLATLIPLVTGLIGATGGFGALGGIGSNLLGNLFSSFGKK